MEFTDPIYFNSSAILLEKIKEALDNKGAEKFFSDPSEEGQRLRESLAGYFFTVALKKDSGKDWWISQPKERFPDFDLMTVSDNPIIITLDRFELVQIPERCATFPDMWNIVEKKLNKGYPPNYHLLIFINNQRSTEWVHLLEQRLLTHRPFNTIWTVHLVFKGENNPYLSVVNRLRPRPRRFIQANFSDPSLYIPEPVPSYAERVEINGVKAIAFKQDFLIELRKFVRAQKIRKAEI